jgi:hypothetical protein
LLPPRATSRKDSMRPDDYSFEAPDGGVSSE